MNLKGLPVLLAAAVFLAGTLLVVPQAYAQELMSQATFNRLERIHDLIDEENYSEARNQIQRLQERSLSPYEQAVVLQTSGHLYILQDQFDPGIREFERALEIGRLPARQNLSLMQNLAQLHAVNENYRRTLDYVHRYLDKVDEVEDVSPTARVYVLGAQANLSLERYRDALPLIRTAIELEDEPRESWYRVWLHINFELQRFDDAVSVLEQMLEYWPDQMRYWQQLFMLHLQQDREEQALAALAIPYRNGLFEEESHYVNLSRMYSMREAPYEAAMVLQDGMDRGIVEVTENRLDMLSRAWQAARETDRAVETLRRLGEMKDDGAPFLRIAQLQQQRANWDAVIDAASEAVRRGGLEKPGQAHLLRGQAAAEKRDFDAALSAFRRAREDSETRRQAEQWIQYVQEEAAALQER